MRTQKSSHGSGKYSLQLFSDNGDILADYNVSQPEYEMGLRQELMGVGGIYVWWTGNPIRIIFVERDGKRFDGNFERIQRTQVETEMWYLSALERELGSRLLYPQ